VATMIQLFMDGPLLAAPQAYAASEVNTVLGLWFPLIHQTSATGHFHVVHGRRGQSPIASM
jgi:hypothetical protein